MTSTITGIPITEGPPRNLNNWIAGIDARLNKKVNKNMTDEEKFACALSRLTGMAGYFAHDYLRKERPRTWEALSEALTDRFILLRHRVETHVALRELRQTKSMSVREYTVRFAEICSDLPRRYPREQLIMDHFISGLKPFLRHEVICVWPKDLKHAMEVAEIMEPLALAKEREQLIEQLREENRCFRCHQKGHRAYSCRNRAMGRV